MAQAEYIRGNGWWQHSDGRREVCFRDGRTWDGCEVLPPLPPRVDMLLDGTAAPEPATRKPSAWNRTVGLCKRVLGFTRRRTRPSGVRADLYDAFEAWGR